MDVNLDSVWQDGAGTSCRELCHCQAFVRASTSLEGYALIRSRPFTPYTTLKFVELAQSIFPPGVVQALADEGQLGPLLVDHPGIAHISFTGSTSTGKKIMQAAAKTLKKVTLELLVPRSLLILQTWLTRLGEETMLLSSSLM